MDQDSYQDSLEPSGTTQDERTCATFIHLAGLASFFTTVPLVGFAITLIMWLLKKDESAFIDAHGRAALNYQLSAIIYFALCLLFVLFTLGLGIVIVALPLIALYVLQIVCSILGAIAANQGRLYRYPLAIPFFTSVRSTEFFAGR